MPLHMREDEIFIASVAFADNPPIRGKIIIPTTIFSVQSPVSHRQSFIKGRALCWGKNFCQNTSHFICDFIKNGQQVLALKLNIYGKCPGCDLWKFFAIIVAAVSLFSPVLYGKAHGLIIKMPKMERILRVFHRACP